MTYTANLLSLYNSSSASHRLEGTLWYPAAREYFTQLAAKYKLQANVVLGVVAATSPFVSWQTQLKRIEPFIRAELAKKGSGTFPGFGKNVISARRILHGESPESILLGPKVSAFYHNLMGDSGQVTLDRHALSAALGYKLGEHEKLSVWTFRKVRWAYHKVSTQLGISRSAFQAIIWNAWKAKSAV